jgi:large subunit ribosomal protein L19
MDKAKKESKVQGKTDGQKAKAGKTTKREIKAKADEHLPLPLLKAGNEIKVYYRVIEGGKERIQVYEGTVIAIKNSGISKTITVRKNSYGIAVERIFPIHSKLIQKIEIKKYTKVRRAKLYYLRELKGKLSRLKELRQ